MIFAVLSYTGMPKATYMYWQKRFDRGNPDREIEDPLSELLLEDKIHGTVTVDYKDGAFSFDSPADKDKQEQPAAPAAD